MFGVISENLEAMRVKASYVDDFSGAAVLDDVCVPTEEKPFQSLVIKWMELDIPFRSTNLVKNRDYVYLEGTGYVQNANGERMGYHLLHSVSFAQTHQLPNRVRGNMSFIGFWRQIGTNTMEMYATSVMDPIDSGLIRKLIVPSMANVFLSTLKYAYCGQMRKLTYMLDKKYAESKMRGTPNKKRICVTCSSPVSSHRIGDFGKSNSTCKLCFGFVCHACKIARKLSFVDPDLLLSQRKVTFCTACISEVTSMSAIDVARTQIAARRLQMSERASFMKTLSSDDSSVDASFSSGHASSTINSTSCQERLKEISAMGKERFRSNPFPELVLSEEDHALLLNLTNTLVQQNFEKYQNFVNQDKRQVDLTRWKHVKSRNNIHVHVRREDPTELQVLQDGQNKSTPVMLSVGTFPGKMDDLMLGVMNPTLETMRMKASYVHDVNDAAILAPIIVPTEVGPFLSVVVKWMQRDLPLESTNLIKNRDFVYIEATGILHFPNGERVGYHLMHSIAFPQIRPLPNIVRGNLSICCMFRQLNENVIDNHSFSTLEPGGELLRFLMIPIAAECLLSAINYEPCGQITKLAWMMQRRRTEMVHSTQSSRSTCAMCMKGISRGRLGSIGRSTCKVCFNSVCMSCKVRKHVSMIAPDGKMLQPKVTFCAMCAGEASRMNALEVARDMARGYDISKMLYASSLLTSSSWSDSDQQ
ncbi:Hypothetical protein PHPALM_37279 [Phytophthora palmivora]|uniref:FYVE-type domain-containing protein n=1 Tax=Phytophthora palmivora TaxID=4796 RepID=A0A2P4WXV6_9STRA|nr:Hypothetical protein PHPALM_37279 [Phytophthora palmivora]